MGNASRAETIYSKSFILGQSGSKRQLRFWLLFLKATHAGAGIPAPPRLLPPWALDAFTDAAGGALDGSGRGAGGVIGAWWFQVAGPMNINRGALAADGKRLSWKMSALGLVGHLICLAWVSPFAFGSTTLAPSASGKRVTVRAVLSVTLYSKLWRLLRRPLVLGWTFRRLGGVPPQALF